jgi:lipid A 3-O-deacylase
MPKPGRIDVEAIQGTSASVVGNKSDRYAIFETVADVAAFVRRRDVVASLRLQASADAGAQGSIVQRFEGTKVGFDSVPIDPGAQNPVFRYLYERVRAVRWACAEVVWEIGHLLELNIIKIKNNKQAHRAIAVSALLFVGAPVALAQQTAAGADGGIGLNVGMGEKYNRVNLNYETAPFYSLQFGGKWGRLDITGELGVAYWWAHQGADRANVWQLIATPMLRWWITDRFYIEGGVGPSVFNHTQFADKTISTAFQFADQVGLGYQLTKNGRLGLRYSHFSNASIKTPNPGLDVTQVTYTYQF